MDPNEDQNHERDYDDAFDEASGEESGVSDDDKSFADGDEPAEQATGAEGDGDAAAAEGAGDADSGSEDGEGDDPAASGEGPAAEESGDDAASEEEPPAEAGKEGGAAPDYDEEAVRKAAEIIQQHQKRTQGDQPVAPQAGTEEEPPAEPEQPKTIDDYIPEDKQEVVNKYRQEWSEVAEAEQVLREAHLQQVQERIYSELRGALAPVFETTQRLQVNAHQEAIRKVHPDLDEVKEDLQAWIAEQPEFVRPAYEQVAKQGSAQEVVELINYYKQAKGTTGAAPAVPASSARTQQKPKPAPKQPPAAAKKAMAAAPSPRQAQPPGSSNPEDYDAAFEEAAGGL